MLNILTFYHFKSFNLLEGDYEGMPKRSTNINNA